VTSEGEEEASWPANSRKPKEREEKEGKSRGILLYREILVGRHFLGGKRGF